MRALLLALLVLSPAAAQPPVSPRGQALIVEFEVGGRAAYDRKYQRPICPACASTASGVTVGIGYDLGHATVPQIRSDWRHHAQVERMVSAQGLGRQAAIAKTRTMQDVVVTWPQANAVFSVATLPRYHAIARRSFGPAFATAPQEVQDALTSVVFNRGGSTVGPGRAEYRYIRDHCLPNGRVTCTAAQIRSMIRLWRGTTIEGGMTRRRNAEAAMAESG